MAHGWAGGRQISEIDESGKYKNTILVKCVCCFYEFYYEFHFIGTNNIQCMHYFGKIKLNNLSI